MSRLLYPGMMIVVFVCSTLAAVTPLSAVEIVDDQGSRIVLQAPAGKIIPLYGAFAEMLYAMGAGGKVMARTQADQYPPEIVGLPSVGTHMKPNVEMILGLKPDLVIQSASRQTVLPEMDRVREAGIPVAVFSPNTFEGIFSAMQRMGVLVGDEDGARRAVDLLEARLEKVRSAVAGISKPKKVFFEVREQPLTAVGGASIVEEIIEAAGGENVLKNEKAIVQYNFESLLPADPEVYVVQSGPMNRNPTDPTRRPHFDRLKAVREGRVLMVDELIFSRPGPRSVDAVEELARKLYPERFP